MAFKSDTYQVFIASPSDLHEERIAASEAVNYWNNLHSLAEGVVLLPVKWETHATPEAGIRGQEVINRELVEPCDILIGMFWTKIGTATGVAESGTVEEIDQFVKAGKPAMLYFSDRTIAPSKINPDQQKKLMEFKAETYKNSLCGSFSDVIELKSTLHKDLTNTVRRIREHTRLKAEIDAGDEANKARAKQERSTFESEILQDQFRNFSAKRDVLAISLIPATPPTKRIDFGPSNELRLRQIINPIRSDVAPLEHYGRSIYAMFPPHRGLPNEVASPQCATELTDTGAMFAVDNWAYRTDENHEPMYRMEAFQPYIVNAVQRYLTGLRNLGVEGIIYFGMSMLKAGKFKLKPTDKYESIHDGLRRGSPGKDIVTETIVIAPDADFSSYQRVTEIIYPALLHFWREAGFSSVPNYDAYGNCSSWIQKL